MTPYRYFTDGSKQTDDTVGCAYLATADERIVGEAQFRLSDGATVFAAEIFAIKEAISDALNRGFSEIDVYSDSRSALEALNSLVAKHRAVAEIKSMVMQNGLRVVMHWIKAHVGHPGNERADELAKEATRRTNVDIALKLTATQAKRRLLNRAMLRWQLRWDHSATGRQTHEVFPRVSLRRLQCDFYLNQIFTGHGTFSEHQERFGNGYGCPCGAPMATIEHSLFVCPQWRTKREAHFQRDYHLRTLRDLCFDPYARKGVIGIVSGLLDWTLAQASRGRNALARAPPNRRNLRRTRTQPGARARPLGSNPAPLHDGHT